MATLICAKWSGSALGVPCRRIVAQLYGLETTPSVRRTKQWRLLGVLISTYLTFDQHVTSVSGQCFYQLRQLRSVRQSLDTESTTTLIRAFVSSRVDYSTAAVCSSGHRVQSQTSFSASSMQLPVLWPCLDYTPAGMRTHYRLNA